MQEFKTIRFMVTTYVEKEKMAPFAKRISSIEIASGGFSFGSPNKWLCISVNKSIIFLPINNSNK